MNRFRNILFVADGSKGEAAALAKVLQLADHTAAKVTVLGVVMPLPVSLYTLDSPPDLIGMQQEIVADARARIERLIKDSARAVPLPAVVMREGVDYLEIIHEAIDGRYDLVVKAAAADAGLADTLFGTLDMRLLRKCPVPVFLMKPRKKILHARVLAALDLDDSKPALNLEILDLASAVAGFEDGTLDLLHVWRLPYEQNMRKEEKLRKLSTVKVLLKDMQQRKQHKLDGLAQRWAALEPRTHLVKGLPELVIPRFTRDHGVDLVVMGTVGRTGLKGFVMGNTAEKVLRALNCSVLAIKPKGFKSPVR